MSTLDNPIPDLESGRIGSSRRKRRRRRRRRSSVAGSTETATTDGSLCFSDDSDREQSWVGSAESRFSEIGSDSDAGDLESGELRSGHVKEEKQKKKRKCRICHMKLEGGGGRSGGGDGESGGGGEGIELGCSCKGELGAAHKQCAETWFKIRGNTTCEICGATAVNVVGEQTSEANSATAIAGAAPAAPTVVAETRNFWHGRRVMNTLLACMVFAFVISWLFHFNVLS
ncbi:uncharacterized protein LOC131316936 [Rhododendron vialii]|uniref:uncharacterized protein LOC131316936 n=1 Tax=Rhododendron vialii TaxID=182163 RepID=UPI00265DDE69|nr:uncharacterized protein LOC131316936 [Rhododendron vialii]